MKYILQEKRIRGHIYPANSNSRWDKETWWQSRDTFIGAKGRIEEKIVPSNNYRLGDCRDKRNKQGEYNKELQTSGKITTSFRRCLRIIKEFKPDAAIGTEDLYGGPVISAAAILKIPTLIQEGNSFAGKTVKILSGRADKVVINFKETENISQKRQHNSDTASGEVL